MPYVWTIKLLAGGLVVFATSSMGFSVARTYRDRPLQLRQLQSALQALATEIAYGATPLPEAFASLAMTTPAPVDRLFAEAAASLRQAGSTAQVAFGAGVDALKGKSALNSTDLRILLQLAPVLGISDRSDQERHLLLTAGQLQREEFKAEEERQRNERMWRYLGVLSGLLLVILLL